MFGVLGIIIYNQSIGGEHNANTRTNLCIIFDIAMPILIIVLIMIIMFFVM